MTSSLIAICNNQVTITQLRRDLTKPRAVLLKELDTAGEMIDKSKSPKGKDKYKNLQKEYKREVMKHVKNLTQIITFQNAIVNAKMLIVKKLNRVRSIGTFIKTSNGFKVSNPEGYVAIDRVSGNAVKLVDRMEFSYNNFTAIKAWDK